MQALPETISVPTYRILQMRDEITQLRRVNELLQARVSTMDIFADALRSSPPRYSEGMGEDIVWVINRALNEAEERLAKEAKETATAKGTP